MTAHFRNSCRSWKRESGLRANRNSIHNSVCGRSYWTAWGLLNMVCSVHRNIWRRPAWLMSVETELQFAPQPTPRADDKGTTGSGDRTYCSAVKVWSVEGAGPLGHPPEGGAQETGVSPGSKINCHPLKRPPSPGLLERWPVEAGRSSESKSIHIHTRGV